MPKISVIMGIHNSIDKDMVQAAIDSILNQSCPDFEFIVCDDGSRDGTFDLLKGIAQAATGRTKRRSVVKIMICSCGCMAKG